MNRRLSNTAGVRRRIRTGLFAVAVAACAASVAGATAGELDPTFGTGGRVTTDFDGSSDAVLGVAVQADNKIVVAGNTCVCAGGDFNAKFALARYNADGTLDTSFGSGGRVSTDFTPGTDAGSAVAAGSDGKIVVAGLSGGHFALALYRSDGSLDTSFGSGGLVTTDFGGATDGGADQANAVAVQRDGRIVAAGGGAVGFALARYNGDATLDTTFGSGGKVNTDVGAGGFAYELAVQGDGKIVAAGRGDGHFALVRYNADGTLDTSFGTGGKVSTDFGSGNQPAFGVDIQADGKIVAAGGIGDFALARYNPNGNLDPTFGSGGKVTTDFGSASDSASAVVVQTDGNIVAAGNGTGDFELARYNPDGTLDGTFGSGGKVTTDFGRTDNAWDVALQSDGRIVVTGNSYGAAPMSDFAVARYKADPSSSIGRRIHPRISTAITRATSEGCIAAGRRRTRSGTRRPARVGGRSRSTSARRRTSRYRGTTTATGRPMLRSSALRPACGTAQGRGWRRS
jgi:uncharacterized delta-60 repeat protein